MKTRTVQVWLLFGARLLCQSNRLSVGGLMPLLAAELGLSVQLKGQLLSAFPLGYMLTQILGGSAADRLGGKPVMALALASVGVGILAVGCLSSFNAIWTTMLLMGLLEGPSFPTNGVLLARWVPGRERATATAISDAGGPVGGLVALFGTPLLASLLGWRLTLIFSGCYTLAFALLWHVKAANGPMECAHIAAQELKELQELGVPMGAEAKAAPQGKGPAQPWRILLLPSVWSVVLAHTAFNYNRYLMYNWIVTYYTDILGVAVAEAGLCMLWPNLFDALASLAVGRAADALAASGRVSALAVRRVFSALGFIGTGAGAMALLWVEGRFMTTVCVTFTSAMQACHNAGFKSTYGDLSREYSGLLRGLGNTLATASSFVVPLIAASLLEQGGGSAEPAGWRAVFLSVLACSVVGTVLFVALVSTEDIDAKLRGDARREAKKEK